METPHDGLEEVPPVKFGHLGGLAMINYRDAGFETFELYEHQNQIFH